MGFMILFGNISGAALGLFFVVSMVRTMPAGGLGRLCDK